MEVKTQRQWSSMVSTSLWGIELVEGEAHPVTDVLGRTFLPDTVEWIKYRFAELQPTSGGEEYQEYIIVYAYLEDHSAVFDLRVQEAPEWLPTPPEGWDASLEEFAKTG